MAQWGYLGQLTYRYAPSEWHERAERGTNRVLPMGDWKRTTRQQIAVSDSVAVQSHNSVWCKKFTTIRNTIGVMSHLITNQKRNVEEPDSSNLSCWFSSSNSSNLTCSFSSLISSNSTCSSQWSVIRSILGSSIDFEWKVYDYSNTNR